MTTIALSGDGTIVSDTLLTGDKHLAHHPKILMLEETYLEIDGEKYPIQAVGYCGTIYDSLRDDILACRGDFKYYLDQRYFSDVANINMTFICQIDTQVNKDGVRNVYWLNHSHRDGWSVDTCTLTPTQSISFGSGTRHFNQLYAIFNNLSVIQLMHMVISSERDKRTGGFVAVKLLNDDKVVVFVRDKSGSMKKSIRQGLKDTLTYIMDKVQNG